MHNRQPTPGKEGRVLITPENGGAPYHAAIVMADDPIEEGTLFAKETILTDPTAAMFGMGIDALPDDVFAFLGKYNQHWWKYRYLASQWVVTFGSISNIVIAEEQSELAETTITYYDSVTVNQTDGSLVLGKSGTITFNYRNYTTANELRGKYFKTSLYGVTGSTLYYCPTGASADTEKVLSSPPKCRTKMTVQPVSSMYVIGGGEWEFVYASDRNAYPDSGENDGKEYEYIGVPFDKTVLGARVETGSYTGTGKNGVSNPNTLTISFTPRMIIIVPKASGSYTAIILDGFSKTWSGTGVGAITTTSFNTTVSWYASSAAAQMNTSGEEYGYIAVG